MRLSVTNLTHTFWLVCKALPTKSNKKKVAFALSHCRLLRAQLRYPSLGLYTSNEKEDCWFLCALCFMVLSWLFAVKV